MAANFLHIETITITTSRQRDNQLEELQMAKSGNTKSTKKSNKSKPTEAIDTLQTENRTFRPHSTFTKQANASSTDIYKSAHKDPNQF